MKKLFCLLLFLISIFSFAQTDKESLKLDIVNSIKAVNASDHEELLKYFPDFVFEYISKEEMLKDLSNGVKSYISEDVQIEIDTILTINSVKYARFYYSDGIRTYGIKTESNSNWTFTDLNEMTKKYIPVEIQYLE
ncbi:hypothetical protein J1N09_03135 [Aureitalea sp. L0-47]|uniref:hypothetical protein n=1 Tax=Aureitalea sp. L0-47 TaxID=2816962 RepID=UPI0022382004|nr:hypothetical protein [Aureitalea sp. L0-47]MCW5518816.1 hypothetical protein [Aureitalea sp. L0-47]